MRQQPSTATVSARLFVQTVMRKVFKCSGTSRRYASILPLKMAAACAPKLRKLFAIPDGVTSRQIRLLKLQKS